MLLTPVLFTIILNSEIMKTMHSFGLRAQQAVERGVVLYCPVSFRKVRPLQTEQTLCTVCYCAPLLLVHSSSVIVIYCVVCDAS